MKQLGLLSALLFLVIFLSCNKTNTTNIDDKIVFEQIDKLIIYSGKDSIPGTCKDLIFEIVDPSQYKHGAILYQNNDTMLACDGYNSIMVDALSNMVTALDENIEISQKGDWDNVGLELFNFAGKGEQYIGYKSCFNPEGVFQFRYGWIKIELSPNGDTLKIISRAINNSTNQPIRTGQLE